jgi:hypothetical protein
MGDDERPHQSDDDGTTPPDSGDVIVHRDLFEGERPDVADAPEVDIAEIIAEFEGQDTTDISALYDTVDHLVEHMFSTPPPLEAQCRLEFTYEGYRVTLTQDGHATFMKVSD